MLLIKKIKKYFLRIISKDEREISRIKKIKRYTSFSTNILGEKFIAIDSASFLGQYQEIIGRNIYNFKSDSECPYIIDCGSNIGLSIIRFKELYPDSKIIGFEPDPFIYNILKDNVKAFRLENVELLQKAVYIDNTLLKFYQEGSAGGHVITSNNLNKNEKIITVDAVRLRDFIDRKIDFLKIDIEGSEDKVIQDIADRLSFVDKLFIEYHSTIGKTQQLDSVLSILKKNNFRYYLEPGMRYQKEPFIELKPINNFDNLINIFAYKN